MDQVAQIAAGLARLGAFGRASMWQSVAELGLTPTQAEILQRVSARPERASDLAAQMGVTPATISDSVAALRAKGLVTRRPDPADRRAQHLVPTDAGRREVARIRPVSDRMQAAIEGLSAPDRGALLGALMRLIRSLQEARAIPVQRMCVTCRHFRPHAHDDARRPHHCDFVNAAFGEADLRLECREHEMAQTDAIAANWRRLDAA